MIFQEALQTRRLVGQIQEGEDVVETLEELCRENDVRAGQIRLFGTLSSVELMRFEAEAQDYVTAHRGEGEYTLSTATGNVSRMGDQVVVRLEGVLSARGPAGPQLLTGQLRRAEAVACEFVIEIFEDLEIERRLESDSGRLEVHAIRRTEKRDEIEEADSGSGSEAIAGKGMSWGDAAEEAEEAAKAPSSTPDEAAGDAPRQRSAEEIYGEVDLDEPLIESGDILEHPKLGNCRVMKVEDGEFVHVRLPRGRIRKLSLEIIDVKFDREEDGRRVFKAVVGN